MNRFGRFKRSRRVGQIARLLGMSVLAIEVSRHTDRKAAKPYLRNVSRYKTVKEFYTSIIVSIYEDTAMNQTRE
jgi:hypothetical protein